ncbi:MAG: hypothetical protein ACJ8CR_04040 [Roseiflexaceae bacterium]
MYHQRLSRRRLCVLFALLIGALLQTGSFRATVPAVSAAGPTLANPILFVTQMPVPADFTTIGSVFGNHRASLESAGRGGDLWIRYRDGTLKNLTAAAKYGSSDPTGFQGANAIAVRDPSVYWDGTTALFSMVVGAPAQSGQIRDYYWQIYEISGLDQTQTPVISKVPHQPANFNNVSPIYGTDDRIIFTSDRPRNGARHLYPQLDEYELAPTNSGLWSLDPASGDLFQLDHAPSGDFTPIIDSFGRVIFTRWDHLQRDQEADIDADAVAQGQPPGYGTFNYADETAAATYQFNSRVEVFPEPRPGRDDLLAGTNMVGHTFNFFFPWQTNEDGGEAETLNHVGRQEFDIYADRSFDDDPNLSYLAPPNGQVNQYSLRADGGLLQIKEDPLTPGRYYSTYAREFGTHAAGQILTISGAPTLNGDQVALTSITHPETASASDTPTANHSGLYRDSLPLSDGTLIAAHTAETRTDTNTGTNTNPGSRYDFRLKILTPSANGYRVAGQPLTAGILKTISYWDPYQKITYTGPMWELNPVEVRARARPARRTATLPAPEQAVFASAGVDPALFKAYLAQQNLAVVVSRNVTTRDDGERQQPFNLRVPGGSAQTIGAPGKIYDVAYMQFFQADQLRGAGLYTSSATPREGRRVLAQPLHDPAAQSLNSVPPAAPASSVAIAGDGSMAAFVPARRAMTWQLTDRAGVPVVRERLWVTFQPGEVRVCASCHGVNQHDQAGHAPPANPPKAFEQLLRLWKLQQTGLKVYLPMARR